MLIDDLGGVTSRLLGLSLDAILQNQDLIANNVANATTPNYLAKSMDFQQVLATYYDARTGQFDEESFARDVEGLKRELDSGAAVDVSAGAVELDEQMIQLTENVLQYKALLEAASKRGALLRLAVSGGRSE